MPTYQYSCTECGHFLEAVQSFTDDSLTVCPECQGRLRKVFNAVGVVFKGSGFYRNDSRSTDGSGTSGSEGGDKQSSKPANGSDSSGADSGSSKSDSSSGNTKSGSSDSGSSSTATKAGASTS